MSEKRAGIEAPPEETAESTARRAALTDPDEESIAATRRTLPSASLHACALALLLGTVGCGAQEPALTVLHGGVPLYDGGFPAWIVTCRPDARLIQEIIVAQTGSAMHFGPEVWDQLSSLPQDRGLTLVFGMIDVHRAVALVLSEARDGSEVLFRGPRMEPLVELE